MTTTWSLAPSRITEAIKNRNLLSFRYHEKQRIVEPLELRLMPGSVWYRQGTETRYLLKCQELTDNNKYKSMYADEMLNFSVLPYVKTVTFEEAMRWYSDNEKMTDEEIGTRLRSVAATAITEFRERVLALFNTHLKLKK